MTDWVAIWTGLITWMRASITAAGEDGDGARIAVADQSRPREAVPYGTIKMIAWDVPRGATEEITYTLGGSVIRAQRTGTLSVQGYGQSTRAWLELMALLLSDPDIIDGLAAAGVTLRDSGGMTDIASIVDTGTEPRYLREFVVDYEISTDARAYAALQSVVIDPITLERYSGAANPHTFALTITV